MPVIVKLHLLFLADSKCGPFLKTKWKEIDILKKKKPLCTVSPVILSLFRDFELLQIVGVFFIVMQFKYILSVWELRSGRWKAKFKCFNSWNIMLELCHHCSLWMTFKPYYKFNSLLPYILYNKTYLIGLELFHTPLNSIKLKQPFLLLFQNLQETEKLVIWKFLFWVVLRFAEDCAGQWIKVLWKATVKELPFTLLLV